MGPLIHLGMGTTAGPALPRRPRPPIPAASIAAAHHGSRHGGPPDAAGSTPGSNPVRVRPRPAPPIPGVAAFPSHVAAFPSHVGSFPSPVGGLPSHVGGAERTREPARCPRRHRPPLRASDVVPRRPPTPTTLACGGPVPPCPAPGGPVPPGSAAPGFVSGGFLAPRRVPSGVLPASSLPGRTPGRLPSGRLVPARAGSAGQVPHRPGVPPFGTAPRRAAGPVGDAVSGHPIPGPRSPRRSIPTQPGSDSPLPTPTAATRPALSRADPARTTPGRLVLR